MRNIFIFPRVSCECQRRQNQRDVVTFRDFFLFTGPITHAQFVNCRACALKNRKPQKWHPVFDYPRARGISIGLCGRDCMPLDSQGCSHHRLRVVSNFGDGDCGAGEIIIFGAPFASRRLEISRARVCVFCAPHNRHRQN